MPPLAKVKKQFGVALGDCRALYRHCLNPVATHSDAGVEAAFLQMYKAWEALLEDCTLAFLCGRLRCDGRVVSCEARMTSEEIARVFLYQDRPFIEWTDIDRTVDRWNRMFTQPNLLDSAVRAAKTELRQMSTIRNAIAHSSPASVNKFRTLVQNQFGGNPTITRPAMFLVSAYPVDPTRTFFDRYADILDVASNQLTG